VSTDTLGKRRYYGMRSIAILVLLANSLLAQSGTSTRGRQHEIAPGSAATRIVHTLKTPPQRGDRFVIDISTDKLRVVLVTPDGRRIDERSVTEAGFSWSVIPFTPPLGTADGGHITVLSFVKPGGSGRYTFEFDASGTKTLGDHLKTGHKWSPENRPTKQLIRDKE
jgi:hypothetical protein